MKKLFYSVILVTGIGLASLCIASNDETPEQVYTHVMADQYEEIDLSGFDDVAVITMKDVEVLDKEGSKVVGEMAKMTVEKHLGSTGKVITTVTGTVAKLMGKDTLTECVLDIVRAPFVIKGGYPESMPELVGRKTQQVVALVPYGDKAVAVAKQVAATKGKETLTEVICDMVSKRDNSDNKE